MQRTATLALPIALHPLPRPILQDLPPLPIPIHHALQLLVLPPQPLRLLPATPHLLLQLADPRFPLRDPPATLLTPSRGFGISAHAPHRRAGGGTLHRAHAHVQRHAAPLGAHFERAESVAEIYRDVLESFVFDGQLFERFAFAVDNFAGDSSAARVLLAVVRVPVRVWLRGFACVDEVVVFVYCGEWVVCVFRVGEHACVAHGAAGGGDDVEALCGVGETVFFSDGAESGAGEEAGEVGI